MYPESATQSQDSVQSIPYDPFSYLRLYPSGWNLDGLQKGALAAPLVLNTAEPEPMPDSYDPFRELNTIPSGWDLSGLDLS